MGTWGLTHFLNIRMAGREAALLLALPSWLQYPTTEDASCLEKAILAPLALMRSPFKLTFFLLATQQVGGTSLLRMCVS